MLEKTIENAVVTYAKKQGIMVRKMNGNGFRGWPDRMFILKNREVFWIEFKAPKGVLGPAQEVVIGDLTDRRHDVYVCDDIAKGKAIIDAELSRGAK